jgi:DnaJ-class molecular chaperone
MNEKKKCEECNGLGEFYSFVTGTSECSACNGTGYMEDDATGKTYFPNCS